MKSIIKASAHSPFMLSAFAGYFMLFIFLAALLSCGTPKKKPEAPDSVETNAVADTSASPADSLDPIVAFLIEKSAGDFYKSQRPLPLLFRDVELKTISSDDRGTFYLICGSFAVKPDPAEAEWTLFATIKTGDYEQWIGGGATGYCSKGTPVPYTKSNLTSLLSDAMKNQK